VAFAAGPKMDPGRAVLDEPTFDAEGEAVMMVFNVEDGRTLDRSALPAQPVFDGMAAAYGRLYLALTDGTVVCMGRGR